MTQQQDPFYQKLPYHLSPDQLNPEYVILGTGLQQSAIAAYLSKMQQKRGLILDIQKTYGSCLKTVSFKELHLLATHGNYQKLYEFIELEKFKELNNKFYTNLIEQKAFRGYNIDIEPSFFFGNSTTCELLKQADMDKYTDFRLVSHMLKYENGKFTDVPLSKGKIFESKQLSLFEKKSLLTSLHTLIKIYQRHMKIEEDQNSTKQFDKGFGQVSEQIYKQFQANSQKFFLPFLQKITKNNKKIIEYFVYIICNYQYDYTKPIPQHMNECYKLKNFIDKFGKFIMSCGIYGEGPYLYVENGIGDISQAFSRIASVFGSTFILHPKIQFQSIEENSDQIVIKSNLAPQSQIKTKKIYFGPTFYDIVSEKGGKSETNEILEEKVLRIFILSKKLGSQEECPSLGYFLDLPGFENPAYLYMFDKSSSSCPPEYMIYQFETIINIDQSEQYGKNSKKIQEKIEILIEKLSEVRGTQFRQSISYLVSYIRTKKFSNSESTKTENLNQTHLQDSFGLDLDTHMDNFIKIIGKKENYYKKKNPNQEQDDDDYYGQRDFILNQLQNIDIHNKQVNQKDSEQIQETPEKVQNLDNVDNPLPQPQPEQNKEQKQIEQQTKKEE